jgi:hypothetical protein
MVATHSGTEPFMTGLPGRSVVERLAGLPGVWEIRDVYYPRAEAENR